jgi:hypothetical protein
MNSSPDLWAYGILFVVLVPFAVFSRFQISKLETPRKELIQFRTALIVFGIFAAFVFIWPPNFPYSYSLPKPDDIDSLEKASRLMARQAEDLNEMAAGLQTLERNLSLVLVCFCGLVLPTLYSFAKAITPRDGSKFSLLNYRSDV